MIHIHIHTQSYSHNLLSFSVRLWRQFLLGSDWKQLRVLVVNVRLKNIKEEVR
eukprot:m.67689 g.67689  ORF g.67689 m.67689 type:complete len:53 (-) comp11588_c0_seq6:827-985(-)